MTLPERLRLLLESAARLVKTAPEAADVRVQFDPEDPAALVFTVQCHVQYAGLTVVGSGGNLVSAFESYRQAVALHEPTLERCRTQRRERETPRS